MYGSRRPSHGSRCSAGIADVGPRLVGREARRGARALRPPRLCSQTDVLGLARMPAAPVATRSATSAIPDRLREVAGEREERLRALGLAALRLVQPRVLERDGRVPGQHLEEPQVVGVELVEAELRDDDDAGHARPVLAAGRRGATPRSRPCRRSARRTRAALRRRRGAASPVSATRPVMPRPTCVGRSVDRIARLGRDQVAAEGDRDEVVVLAEEDAAVVVVDEEPELVGDRERRSARRR